MFVCMYVCTAKYSRPLHTIIRKLKCLDFSTLAPAEREVVNYAISVLVVGKLKNRYECVWVRFIIIFLCVMCYGVHMGTYVRTLHKIVSC